MAITIDRDQRDAMYQEVVLDLNGLTDLWTEFSDGNYDRAKELRQRFVFDMRLLDDLGWEPEQDADEFALTMDGVDLAWVVSHLIEQTGAIHTQYWLGLGGELPTGIGSGRLEDLDAGRTLPVSRRLEPTLIRRTSPAQIITANDLQRPLEISREGGANAQRRRVAPGRRRLLRRRSRAS